MLRRPGDHRLKAGARRIAEQLRPLPNDPERAGKEVQAQRRRRGEAKPPGQVDRGRAGELPGETIQGEGVEAQAGRRKQDEVAASLADGDAQAAPDPRGSRRLAKGVQLRILPSRLEDQDIPHKSAYGAGDKVGEQGRKDCRVVI